MQRIAMTTDNWIALAIAALLLIGFIAYVDRQAQKEFDERKDGWK